MHTDYDTRIFMFEAVGLHESGLYISRNEYVFTDVHEMVCFLASHTKCPPQKYGRRFSNNCERWDNPFIQYAICPPSCKGAKDELNRVLMVHGHAYVYYDSSMRFIHPLFYWKEIMDAVFAIQSSLIPDRYDCMVSVKRKKKFQGRHYHTHYCEKLTSQIKIKSAVYIQDDEWNSYRIEKIPFSDRNAIEFYDKYSRNSSGWKFRKHKKQWMHNQYMKEMHEKNADRKRKKKNILQYVS